jgi:hypothetical protein
MAITDDWAGHLERGYAPLGSTTDGVPDVKRIGSRDQLYNWLMGQAQEGGVGGYTQQDVYDFFIKPEEQRRFRESEERFRSLYGQAQRVGSPAGQAGARLGLGGTGLGARMGEAIGRQRGGVSASRGLAEAQQSALQQIERPGRLSQIDDLVNASQAATARQGREARDTWGGIGAGTSAALGATAAGLAASGIGAPLAAIPLGILAAIAAATGTSGGLSTQEGILKQGAKRMSQFRGAGPVQQAEFNVAPMPTTQPFGQPGMSEFALSNAYRPQEDEQGAFLYGA